MMAAIRVGCNAAEVHPACSWPECRCTQLPRAIHAAVEFTAHGVAAEVAKEWKLFNKL